MKDETTIISVHSGKGGVGKTTFVSNLGAALSSRGNRVLLIDSDFFTHGMTFLLSKNHLHAKIGYLEILKNLPGLMKEFLNHSKEKSLDIENINTVSDTGSSDEIFEETKSNSPQFIDDEFGIDDSILHQVDNNLFLLPPTVSGGRRLLNRQHLNEVIFDELINNREDVRLLTKETFRVYMGSFEFVLFDCRSGTDVMSILPSFLSDEYWIVTEEDNTSIRATNFLLEAMEDLGGEKVSSDSQSNGYENDRTKYSEHGGTHRGRFGGFIINMMVSNRPYIIAESLERIFSANCLAATPLSRRTRLAFINDKLIFRTNPRDRVSREIRELVRGLEQKNMRSAVGRLKKKEARSLTNRLILALTTLMVPVAIYYFVFSRFSDLYYAEWILKDPFWMIPAFAVSVGFIATFAALIYGRRLLP